MRTKDTAVTQDIPRDFGTLCQKLWSKTKHENKRCPSHPYLQGFEELWVRNQGQRPEYVYFVGFHTCLP